MATKQGTLSINSENILPIIKKWMYSDHDIFYREVISNGCDAITKLKKLDMMGEFQLPADYKPQIQIIVNPEEKTLLVHLTQQESLRCKAGDAIFQIRLLLSDLNALATVATEASILEIYKDGVIE